MESHNSASFLASPAIPTYVTAAEAQVGDLVLYTATPTLKATFMIISNTEVNSVIAGIPMRLISWVYLKIGHPPLTYEVRMGPCTSLELLSRTQAQ